MKISIHVYASLFTVYIVLCFIFILIQLLFVSKTNAKFCHKKFPLLFTSHDYWTRNWNSVTDEIWNPGAGLEF